MNERIKTLKKEFLNATRQIDVERAVLVTESYQKTTDKPEILRRAIALQDILLNTSIVIRDNELIVGAHAKKLRAVPLFPEYATDWLETQMDDFMTRPGDQFLITEEQKSVVRECLKYWKGKSLRDRVMSSIPEDVADIMESGVISNVNYTMSAPGHTVPHYEYLLRTGYANIKQRAKDLAEALDRHAPDYIDKFNFYQAIEITCDAVIDFARRYSDLAIEMAQTEKRESRREELLEIADICRNVPANPAKNFREALQFVYFVQLIIQIEGNGLAIGMGRMDCYLKDLYMADKNAGNLTHEVALELMECLFLKINEIDKVYSNEATRALQGPAHGQTITIGGVDCEGNDVTNDITLLVLEADYETRLVQPDIAVRIHPNTPGDLLMAATRNVKSGINKVKIFNDTVINQSMKNLGIAPEDCYNYSFLGCSEPVVDGKTDSWGNSGHINLAKMIELALNDGRCLLTGKQLGPHTGDATTFDSIEDVKKAYKTQVAYFVNALTIFDNILDNYQAKYAPLPFYSTVITDCVGRGIEFNAGGAVYNTTSPLGIGPITAGDSLEAIKKIVFEDVRISMQELLDALRCDFEGKETIRLMLQNRAPKYGNDIDEADEMSRFVADCYYDELAKYKNFRGGPYTAGLYYLTANIPHGSNTAATPDGRKARTPLNDGGVSPTHGMDRKGATAVLKSAGKLNNYRAGHGCVLNQLLHPSIFNGTGGDEAFCAYMRGMVRTGSWESQFNVITPEELRKAQEKPEEYKSLVVRVAGYSAYFTALEKEMQDDIIDRTLLTQY